MELLDVLVAKLNTNNHFHLARYGDGEWKAMLGEVGKNIDGHLFNLPGLKEDLLKTIKEHKPYFYGMQGLVKRQYSDRIKPILNGLFIPWIDADLFHHASAKGTLNPFMKALRKKKVCCIGPKHLTEIESTVIHIPKKNCYLEKEAVKKRISLYCKSFDIFLFSAGFLSNILIWELHEEFKNKWMIDVGSLFDPYCNVNSRSYHNKLTEKTKRKNFA